ncbi:glycosyltransferase family 4 protein [Candidatus Pelagibacter sp. Uisw_090]|uniref:glycosyltransferase family 4 protein n=1 Tax=Candidatus Pelagibacter sp. Uisw_090 TaxID=3230993 RepID=UPI0039ED84BE
MVFVKLHSNIKKKSNLAFHSHLSRALYATFIPSLIFRIPHIHTEHNTFNRRREKWYLYLIEYFIYNSLKSIICVSEATRYELLSYMPSLDLDKVVVIENGTELIQHKIRNFSKKKKFNIIVLGSLTHKKGIDLLLSSIPHLVDKINKIKIIGSGPEREKLLNLINKFSLNSLVELIDHTEDIKAHLYDADIGVVPSRWEGFGLVAVEMRSSGLPILISDVPGLSDIFSHYNAVVSFKVGSKDSLKNSLNALLEDLSNDRIVVKDLKSDLENYSIQNFLKRYEEFYKKI